MILDGKTLAQEIIATVKQAVKPGAVPGLAVVQVGDDPASGIYVAKKEKACKDVGFFSRRVALPESISEADLIAEIKRLNADPRIHGILLQLPVPQHIDALKAQSAISPSKDVDGLHPENIGFLCMGSPRFIPCTPKGIIRLLDHHGIAIEGKHVVIIGRSNLVGKPLAQLFLLRNATLTICHSKTADLAAITQQADILVSAVGKPGLVTPAMVKPGAVVIDVGITRIDGKVIGDVDPAVMKKASAMTPVPGGVGPMTIAMLLENTLEAMRRCR
ncbi:MAG: bifunctional methylenetetrahydrofolate dehydrogenase/methenyltetrahydrofolate cyclohydrolase FolD [Nanoarchaeota archaeon]